MKTLTALVIALCLSTSAQASDRIAMASHTGALTSAETQHLRQEQVEISRFRTKAFRDGHLSFWERRSLKQKENAFDRLFHILVTNRAHR